MRSSGNSELTGETEQSASVWNVFGRGHCEEPIGGRSFRVIFVLLTLFLKDLSVFSTTFPSFSGVSFSTTQFS